MKVMEAMEPNIFTISQKKGALWAINLIKEKQSRKIKGRTCADGRPQICYIPKEDAPSLTICLEDLFNRLIIDAHKGRHLDFLISLGHKSTIAYHNKISS